MGPVFMYERKGDSAVIRRCFSHEECVVIPEQICGLPVTEVGPYCFSAHMDEKALQKEFEAGKLQIFQEGIGFLSVGRQEEEKPVNGAEPDKSCKEIFGSSEQRPREEKPASGAERGKSRETVFGPLTEKGIQTPGGLIPPLCGNNLKELVLPGSVRRVGRYCLYNCGALEQLEFDSALSDWGSGVFTGCHHIRKIRLYLGEDGKSSLKQMLDEVPEAVEVEFLSRNPGQAGSTAGNLQGALDQTESTTGNLPGSSDQTRSVSGSPAGLFNRIGHGSGDFCFTGTEKDAEEGAVLMARLIFPEFYEEGVENTPARILETHVHGSGILYRNCFQSRVFDFQQYDRLLPYAVAREDFDTTARLVTGRLWFPYELSEAARRQYEEYVISERAQFAELFVRTHDMRGIRWLTETAAKTYPGLYDLLMELAGRAGFVEAIGFLMESRRMSKKKDKEREIGKPAPAARRRRFEL